MKLNRAVVSAGIGLLCLVIGFGVATAMGMVKPGEAKAEVRTSEVLNSIRVEDDVVLMSLGIQGIAESSTSRKVWGIEVPGSDRTLFLQHKFSGKLGLDGSEVKISQVAEKKYHLVIPQFKFLGHSDAEFKTAVEQNGAISWVTPEIDVPELVTQILSEDAKSQHVDDNRELLEAQCRTYYTSIVHAIEPEAEVTFEFSPGL